MILIEDRPAENSKKKPAVICNQTTNRQPTSTQFWYTYRRYFCRM